MRWVIAFLAGAGAGSVAILGIIYAWIVWDERAERIVTERKAYDDDQRMAARIRGYRVDPVTRRLVSA